MSFVHRFALLCTTFFACGAARTASAPSLPHVPTGFSIERIATVESARELAIAPNGDLFIGTLGNDVYVVANAQSSRPQAPLVFAHVDDAPAAGVALGRDTLYIGAQFGIYRVAYSPHGARSAAASPVRIATVRTSGRSRDHVTTTLAAVDGALYASVGSSCDACIPELDSSRATIQRIDLATGHMTSIAIHIRNAIALAINPSTSTLWAGVAGADALPLGHPYEIFDAVSLQRATPRGAVDYGWPSCYENRRAVTQWPADCSNVAVPRVILPAYETPIGATFYPNDPHGRYAFPDAYRGGAFVTLHGSWHGPSQGLPGYVPPRVVFIPMRGDTPARAADWNDPNVQWSEFADGYQRGGTIARSGRPTGIVVAPDGSLFLADDLSGAIYRIRPKMP